MTTIVFVIFDRRSRPREWRELGGYSSFRDGIL